MSYKTDILVVEVENDYPAYQQLQTIKKNLSRRKDKGTYDPAKAPVAFKQAIDAYLMRTNKTVRGYTAAERMEAAKELTEGFEEEYAFVKRAKHGVRAKCACTGKQAGSRAKAQRSAIEPPKSGLLEHFIYGQSKYSARVIQIKGVKSVGASAPLNHRAFGFQATDGVKRYAARNGPAFWLVEWDARLGAGGGSFAVVLNRAKAIAAGITIADVKRAWEG